MFFLLLGLGDVGKNGNPKYTHLLLKPFGLQIVRIITEKVKMAFFSMYSVSVVHPFFLFKVQTLNLSHICAEGAKRRDYLLISV